MFNGNEENPIYFIVFCIGVRTLVRVRQMGPLLLKVYLIECERTPIKFDSWALSFSK